ncbi:hypothetical protein BVY03_00720 [bacterium K02(2017)]|nr:hypothetical protein BVY03_00720 [bacterium K02(2017)]
MTYALQPIGYYQGPVLPRKYTLAAKVILDAAASVPPQLPFKFKSGVASHRLPTWTKKWDSQFATFHDKYFPEKATDEEKIEILIQAQKGEKLTYKVGDEAILRYGVYDKKADAEVSLEYFPNHLGEEYVVKRNTAELHIGEHVDFIEAGYDMKSHLLTRASLTLTNPHKGLSGTKWADEALRVLGALHVHEIHNDEDRFRWLVYSFLVNHGVRFGFEEKGIEPLTFHASRDGAGIFVGERKFDSVPLLKFSLNKIKGKAVFQMAMPGLNGYKLPKNFKSALHKVIDLAVKATPMEGYNNIERKKVA